MRGSHHNKTLYVKSTLQVDTSVGNAICTRSLHAGEAIAYGSFRIGFQIGVRLVSGSLSGSVSRLVSGLISRLVSRLDSRLVSRLVSRLLGPDGPKI